MLMFVFLVLALFLLFFYLYVTSYIYKHWERRQVKGPKPSFLFGNAKSVSQQKDNIISLTDKIYEDYPNERYVGMYLGLSPVLVIRDIEIIQNILIKEFPNFMNRGFQITNEEISSNVFTLDGDEWRVLRQRLSPIFTSGKLKNMMPIMNGCVKEFIQYVNYLIDNKKDHEIRALTSKYTLKGITSCAFGLETDTFSNDFNIFTEMGDKLQKPNLKLILCQLIDSLFPGIIKKLNIELLPKEASDFFYSIVYGIIKEREGKPKTRKDFMDLMIELKEEGVLRKEKEGGVMQLAITDATVVAQALVFYLAGFDTTSGTMSFMFYELARHPDIQERCYKEIKSVMEKYNGELTLEAIKDMEYVSWVFDETLRKHPVVGALFRQTTKECKLPRTELTLKACTKIFLPVPAIHNDPKYYPNPEKFDPERFSPENRDKIPTGAYLPFGDGPRNCIGMRFARVQAALAIAHFLYRFKLETTEKTVDKITYDPVAFTLSSKDGIWLKISKR